MVETEHAGSYLKQLCRHWGHKFPVEMGEDRGLIELPAASCALVATPVALEIELVMKGDEADQARLERVVAEHVERFAFRETLVFAWGRVN